MLSTLEFILIMLAVAVVGVVIFRYFQLPSMLGYLVVGSLVGPHALSILGADSQWTHLAEFGVVFLMFSIGLEFSLAHLMAIRRLVFGLGSLQVALILLVCLLINALLPPTIQLTWAGAFAIGVALAMSSTAVVLQSLKERQELETQHGRKIIGILLLQDLIFLPLFVLITAFTQPSGNWQMSVFSTLLKMTLVLLVLFYGGRWLIQKWLSFVSKARLQELFMLNLLLIVLGAAWLTESFGLSLAMGAFIAGMLIAETDFRHHVEEDIEPFRDVLLGLFFVTTGSLLNWDLVLSSFAYVLLFLLIFVILKFALISVLAYYFGRTKQLGSALRTGLALAQTGEFSFVVLHYLNTHAQALQIEKFWLQVILAGMVCSMLLTPFLIKYSDQIVARFSASEWLQKSLELTQLAAHNLQTPAEVLIAGYGRCGQHLATLLRQQSVEYCALDMDVDKVVEGRHKGDTVFYGDARRRETLSLAGLSRAKILIVTFHDEHAAYHLVRLARELAPQLYIIARAVDEKPMTRLLAAGASEVVPDALEASLMLASHALVALDTPLRQVVHLVQHSRENQYGAILNPPEPNK